MRRNLNEGENKINKDKEVCLLKKNNAFICVINCKIILFMKNSFLLLVWIVVSITSCNTDDVQVGTNESPIITKMNDGDSTSPTNKDPNYFLKSEFSRALAKVFSESKEVRELIKKEALKK